MPVKTVLFVHQSAEMYGSDKVLLYLALGLRPLGIHPVVLLPEEGPLTKALRDGGVETHIVPVTKLDRSALSPKGLVCLPFSLVKSMFAINRVIKGRNIDVVYSNTLAVLGAAVWARLRGVPHVWHVHEILLSPSVVRRGFPLLLRLLADKVVCNSKMTCEWLVTEQPALSKKTEVIWNGQGSRPAVNAGAAVALRERLQVPAGQPLVALVGRINRWKGQALLIETANLLWDQGFREVHYVIVGSAFAGQEHLIDELNAQINKSAAGRHIHITPFTDDVWSVWDACNIAVVPSTEPEPFGMVAIEAMASGKPVVVAGHGGLLDIVEHAVSGLHFEPNNAKAFANELQKLLTSRNLRTSLGLAGKSRQEQLFSLDGQINSTAAMLNVIGRTDGLS
jgi:glycosyltransferase involved in cell wall biosynthesis